VKITQIKEIRGYKAFKNFKWEDFFGKNNNNTLHERVNIFYGENGCGKSSICSILKAASDESPFDLCPEKASLTVNHSPQELTYQDGQWENHDSLKKGDILFFDQAFVIKNIHTHGERRTTKDGHEQESGNLIIEFDQTAIDLKNKKTTAKAKLDEFNKEHKKDLKFGLTEKEIKTYDDHFKNKDKDELSELIEKKKSELPKKEQELEKLKDRQKRSSEIENLKPIDSPPHQSSILSSLDDYQNIFNFDTKEQSSYDAAEATKKKINGNKDFFKTGIDIYEQSPPPKCCPFCESKSEESRIKEIIKIYHEIFDQAHKDQQELFLKRKMDLSDEIDLIINSSKKDALNSVFNELENTNLKMEIKDLYSAEERSEYLGIQNKLTTKSLQSLKNKLDALENPDNENINEIYNAAKKEFDEIQKYIQRVSNFVESKNKAIKKFQSDNKGDSLNENIKNTQAAIDEDKKIIDFYDNNFHSKHENNNRLKKEQTALKEQSDKCESVFNEHVNANIFDKQLERIEKYFEKFDFNFKLKLLVPKSNTKEPPFSFAIEDTDGKKRALETGLSEGERQVLSLCFFFAFLDAQANKEAKILVFDDPISSLDNSNLEHLVDLIKKEYVKFSQTLIFTHNKPFLHFLRKKFSFHDKNKEKSKEYVILKNEEKLGGSFIAGSNLKNTIHKKLKTFLNRKKAQNGQGLHIEEECIKYGQYLRYEVERLIKNDLLGWNKQQFPEILETIKNNQKISDQDFDKIKEIYDFCNWTTAHVAGCIKTGEDEPGYKRLSQKIEEFINIQKKFNKGESD